MKIVIATHVLSRKLEEVSKALPSKATVPILAEIYIRADHEGLTLLAGDTATSIMAKIEPDEFEMIKAGSITLPGKIIVEIVKKLKGDITIEVKDTFATITSKGSDFDITGMDGDEYPQFPEVSGDNVKIKGSLLRELIDKTIFSASEVEETMILTGVKFEFSNGKISLTSTDRHRMSQVDRAIDCESSVSVVIGKEHLKKMRTIFGDKDEVELCIGENNIMAKSNGYTFYSRVLEGAYPEISRIVPREFNGEVIVNRQNMLFAIERVMIIAKDDNGKIKKAAMDVTDKIELSSTSGANKKVVEKVEFKSKSGEEFKFHANVKFIEDALRAIDEEEVIVQFVAKKSPLIFRGLGNEQEFFLILPYQVQ